MGIWKETKNWLQDWSGAVVGVVLIGLGFVGLWRVHSELGHALSETAVVAGLVTLTVDPFIKHRLIGEASKDIFRYLLGFELPRPIREALQEHLFNTENYREDVRIEVQVTSDGDHVTVLMTATGKVVAITDCEYHQYAAFEASEQGQILGASIQGHRDPTKDYDLTHEKLVLVRKPDEPMVFEWKGNTVTLQAEEKIGYRLQTEIKRAKFDFVVQNFGAAIVGGTIVRVSCSDDLEVSASKSTRQTGNEYIYEQVFLPGDHIQIRWQPKQP